MANVIPLKPGKAGSSPTALAAATTDPHQAFMKILGELIFVVVLSFIAGTSDDAGNAVILFFLALWAVWLVMNYSKVTEWAAKFGIK